MPNNSNTDPLKPVPTALAALAFVRVSMHIFLAFGLACVYPRLSAATQRRSLKAWSAKLLRILRLHHHAEGFESLSVASGYLMVANHVSWLDIFAINAAAPTFFVAKSEVRQWPVLGWLVHRSGTLFVQRTQARDAVRVNNCMADLLQQGRHVGLFAQGTSTRAREPVDFHAALFQSAINARASVVPLVIDFHDHLGRNLKAVEFTGDTTFGQSLWRILRAPKLHVRVTCLPPIFSADLDRRELARLTQQAVNRQLAQSSALDQGCHTNRIKTP